MMKYIQFLILIFLIPSCNENVSNEFRLDVKVNGDYKGYLYLNYNEKKDSCKITNGKASFNGKVSNPAIASYNTNNISANDKNFYIENVKIKSEITISKKNIKGYKIDWISINNVSGTKTSVIKSSFENFKLTQLVHYY